MSHHAWSLDAAGLRDVQPVQLPKRAGNPQVGGPVIVVNCTDGKRVDVDAESLEGADLSNLDLHRAELG